MGSNPVLHDGVNKNPWDIPPQGAVDTIGVIKERVALADFVDQTDATGEATLTAQLPAGALVLRSKVIVLDGFVGDTTAVLEIGDGTDPDRFNTGTPSVLDTALTGVDVGAPSGEVLVPAALNPVLTVTGGADFTSISAGELEVSIYFIRTQ